MSYIRLLILLAFTSGSLLFAKDDYYDKRKKLEVRLRARSVDAATVAAVKAFLKEVENKTDRKLSVQTMLAHAYAKSKQPKKAIAMYKEVADGHAKSQASQRALYFYRARIDCLRVMERMRPVPAGMLTLAKDTLSWEGAKHWSADQKMSLTALLAEAIEASRDRKAAVQYLEKEVTKAEPKLKAKLLLHLTGLANGEKGEQYLKQLLGDPSIGAMAKASGILQSAYQHSRARRKSEALALAKKALPHLHASKTGRPDWRTSSDIRWAAGLYRRSRDFKTARAFVKVSYRFAGTNRNQIGEAQREEALILADEGKPNEADDLFKKVKTLGDRPANQVVLDHALLVYHKIDPTRGEAMLRQALGNSKVNDHVRYNTVMAEARDCLKRGDRVGALKWFEFVSEIPGSPRYGSRYVPSAWYEIGRIYQSKADNETAKKWYTKAEDYKGGDAQTRVRARNAIEQIEYFE